MVQRQALLTRNNDTDWSGNSASQPGKAGGISSAAGNVGFVKDRP